MRLFLCEKPSQGKDIARVVGAIQRGNGCYKGKDVAVTWCIGHLVEAVPPEAYDERFKRWSLDDLPIIPDTWRVEVKKDTAAQYKIVRRMLSQSRELVIATDADREGEMIARELLELCRYKGTVFRLWLSALNEASIHKALACLRPAGDTLPLYHSALARARADWLVGMNMTRLFTLLGRRSGLESVLSVGRVQTPTLRLVVDRDREIERFVPRPFWSIEIQLCSAGKVFLTQWMAPDSAVDRSGRCIRQAVAQAAFQELKQAQHATVMAVETQRVRADPPLPFDLSTLQQVCSRRFGFGVQETLDIAQSLYETHKAITYPRTDSGYLPESMLADAEGVLRAMAISDPGLQALVQSADIQLRSRAWDDGKTGSHHGIIPTLEPVRFEHLNEQERLVYRLVSAHFLVQFLPHYEYDRTCVQLICEGYHLQAYDKRVVDKGWRDAAQGPIDDDNDAAECGQVLPALSVDDRCSFQCIQLHALKTQAPSAYTQGELIKAMKNVAKLVMEPRLKQTLKDTAGIGTEATRANVISSLLNRGYLYTKGRSIHASDAAYTVIDAIPAAIADPATTAIWEQAFDKIEAGEMTLECFVAKQTVWVTQLVEHYRTATLSLHTPGGPNCPLCGASMRQRNGKHGTFWSCSRYPDCHGVLPIAKRTLTTTHRRTRRRSPPKGD
ncbi:DNA topoisomerase III [Pseudomonas sp. 91RF]|jgi:DNA topoisomerase-3|uniref:DNA topoisomerase III n=1 Tax=Pseudomonas sp. 91RF TaxID=2292261 RepID=UPI000E66A71A|nr:DNA topoisomerase III [Pseudomonas sp. 91RF]RIJ09692.1 DNA topoisomerase III [Pseudomonas sp. 91RF]